MRHVLQWTVCVIWIGACAMLAVGKDIPSTLPTTRGADEAKDAFDAATSAANDRMDTANATAASAYLAELKTALASAMASGNLAESNGIKAEIDQISSGSGISADAPRRPGTLPARIKYDRAILKAREDFHRGVEAARRQYITNLQLAVKAALQDQDLDEANRINAVIEEVKEQPAVTRAANHPSPPAASAVTLVGGHRQIDLLRLVNPTADAASGEWSLKDGNLAVTPSHDASIGFPYVPPHEYDYRAVFVVANHVGDFVGAILTVNGHQFMADAGSYGNTTVRIGGTNVRRDSWLAVGQRYSLLLKVRADTVAMYLNDEFIATVKASSIDDRFQLRKGFSWISRQDVVGLSTNGNAVTFESAEVTEITGDGTLLRGDAKPAAALRAGVAP